MKKLFNNKNGFTLAEVLIAGGISALVALVAYTTLQSSQKSITVSLVGAEVSDLKNLLINNLGQSDVCAANFVGKPVTQTDIPALYKRKKTTTGANYSVVYTADVTNTFVQKNTTYGKDRSKAIRITNISTYPTIIPKSSPATINPNSMTVQVDYEVIGSGKAAGTDPVTPAIATKTDKILIDIFIGKTGPNVASCFTDIAGLIRQAVKGACYSASAGEDTGAIYNANEGVYGSCTHPSVRLVNEAGTTVAPSATTLCPTGEFLWQVSINAGSVSGGSPSVTTPGFITLACKKFTTPSGSNCPANSFAKGIKADGTPDCESLFANWPAGTNQILSTTTPYQYRLININCPADQVVQSVDNTGNRVCVPKVQTASCPVGQVVKAINSAGAVTCGYPDKNSGSGCGAGTYLRAVNSDGSIPGGGCAPLAVNAICADARFVMAGIDSNGNAICQYRYW